MGVLSRPAKTTATAVRAPNVQKAASDNASKKKPAQKVQESKKTIVKPVYQTRASRGPQLPNTPASKGLHVKNPTRTHLDNQMKNKSPWYNSIKDPLHGADCKIPDETGVETGTVQIVQRQVCTVGENGIVGFRVLSPYANFAQAQTAPAPRTSANWQIVAADSSESTISWGVGTQLSAGQAIAFDGIGELQAISNAHRIVSCAVYATPEMALSDCKGELCAFANEFSYNDSPYYDSYLNQYKSVINPVNNNSSSVVRWYPVAREDQSFKSFMSTRYTEMTTVMGDNDQGPYWSLGFVGAGLQPGSAIRFTVIVNYEFIPSYNTMNIIDVSPSPNDALETDLVENWVQSMPIAEPVSSRKANSSPSTVEPSHDDNPTPWGMLFNVVEMALPLLGFLL